METLLIVLVTGALCCVCFFIGAKVGQTVSKGETLEIPNVNPFEAYRKHEAKKEAEIEQEKFDTILRNIEQYDGTGKNQRDVG